MPPRKKTTVIGTPELVPWIPPGKPKEETFNTYAHKKNSGQYDLTASQMGQVWSTSNSKKFSTESSPWSIRWNKDNKSKKNSLDRNGKRINDLLNASHNSQAERDYLRQQILKIFEEDERALEEYQKDYEKANKNVPSRNQARSSENINNAAITQDAKRRAKSMEENLGDQISGRNAYVTDASVQSSVDRAVFSTPNRKEQPSHEMIILNDLESQDHQLNYHSKKSSEAQTEDRPILGQNRSTSTDHLISEKSQTDSLEDASLFGHSPVPVGFRSVNLERWPKNSSTSPLPANAWIIFPDDQSRVTAHNARPLNLAASIGSQLRHSFAQINRSTPVESIISTNPLIEEDIDEKDPKELREQRKRNAFIAAASVGGGAFILAALVIGGVLLATSSDSGVTSGSISNAGFLPISSNNNDSSACTQYTRLEEPWRRITGFGPYSSNGRYYCDTPKSNQVGIREGWHRFVGAAGTHLPTEAPNTGAGNREVCGTSIVAWMQGTHPTIYEGVVFRNFCFEWTSGPCQFTVRSLVRTCPDPDAPGQTFYVYFLKYPPDVQCYWGYCAMG